MQILQPHLDLLSKDTGSGRWFNQPFTGLGCSGKTKNYSPGAGQRNKVQGACISETHLQLSCPVHLRCLPLGSEVMERNISVHFTSLSFWCSLSQQLCISLTNTVFQQRSVDCEGNTVALKIFLSPETKVLT